MSLKSEGEIIGLGIESSCDETSVAVVKNGRESLANVIYSQIDEHAPFRGVVPEIAGRAHLEKINHVYAQALKKAGVQAADLDYVAVTGRPGLIGSLIIGAQLARCITMVHGMPLVPVNHLEAHFYAATLEGHAPEYPFLGLLLSGGNSAIYRVTGPQKMERIADTYDDALGEAFDKAASVLSLPYPGGPAIEKKAEEYSPAPGEESLFPRLLKNLPNSEMAFSFSGIKTAVLRAHQEGRAPERICYDFMDTAFEMVERMVKRAVKNTGIPLVVASGGVLANTLLRKRLTELSKRGPKTGKTPWRFRLVYPESRFLCTDNAGMVAALGYYLYREGVSGPLDFAVNSK